MIDGVIGTIKFLSTLSLRRATCPRLLKPLLFQISIHALLAESDSGTRLQRIATIIFLSTLSLRRATNGRRGRCNDCGISIHALLAESDPIWQRLRRPRGYFYPRSPCGERPVLLPAGRLSWRISIHALLAESDAEFFCVVYVLYISIHALLAVSDPVPPPCGIPDRISIHALLAESDFAARPWESDTRDFYPRSPCGERPALGGTTMPEVYFYPRSPCGERLSFT